MTYSAQSTSRWEKHMPDMTNEQMFHYRTSLGAQLRGTSTCGGPGPAQGMLCASSNLRTTIAGDLPYLHHRSYLSSGGPLTSLSTDFPDTLGTALVLTEAQKLMLNQGDSLMSYDVRLLGSNDVMRENTGVFARQMFPNTWRTSFTFMPTLGSNTMTRLQSGNLAIAKDELLRGQVPSYGSYGVVMVR
jgi:hypothetical protein